MLSEQGFFCWSVKCLQHLASDVRFSFQQRGHTLAQCGLIRFSALLQRWACTSSGDSAHSLECKSVPVECGWWCDDGKRGSHWSPAGCWERRGLRHNNQTLNSSMWSSLLMTLARTRLVTEQEKHGKTVKHLCDLRVWAPVLVKVMHVYATAWWNCLNNTFIKALYAHSVGSEFYSGLNKLNTHRFVIRLDASCCRKIKHSWHFCQFLTMK